MATTPNVYEALAREQKVSKLVDTMHANGWASLAMLNGMKAEHWAYAERLAGVKSCSAVTRQMVSDRIRQSAPPVPSVA